MEYAKIRQEIFVKIAAGRVITMRVLTFEDDAHKVDDIVMQKIIGTVQRVLKEALSRIKKPSQGLRCAVDELVLNVSLLPTNDNKKSIVKRLPSGMFDAFNVHPMTVEVMLTFAKDTRKRQEEELAADYEFDTKGAPTLKVRPNDEHHHHHHHDDEDDEDDIFMDPKRKRPRPAASSALPPKTASEPAIASAARRTLWASSASASASSSALPSHMPPSPMPLTTASSPVIIDAVDELTVLDPTSSPKRTSATAERGSQSKPLTRTDDDPTTLASKATTSSSQRWSSPLSLLDASATSATASQDDTDDVQIVGIINKDVQAELKIIEKDIEDIFRGNIKSWRRDAYVAGGKQREKLKSSHSLLGLSEGEIEKLSNLLLEKYAHRGKTTKHAFVLDVLLPEAIVRILMGRYNLTFEEAEAKMNKPNKTSEKRQKQILAKNPSVEMTEDEKELLRERLQTMGPLYF